MKNQTMTFNNYLSYFVDAVVKMHGKPLKKSTFGLAVNQKSISLASANRALQVCIKIPISTQQKYNYTQMFPYFLFTETTFRRDGRRINWRVEHKKYMNIYFFSYL